MLTAPFAGMEPTRGDQGRVKISELPRISWQGLRAPVSRALCEATGDRIQAMARLALAGTLYEIVLSWETR